MPTGCASAWSTPASGEPVQVVCGAPNARAGMIERVLAAGHVHSGQEHHARRRHHPRRREPRHAGVAVRAADLRRSRRHPRPAGRCAARRALRRMGPSRRSRDRDQPDAEPAGLPPACTASRATLPPPTWASSRTRRSSRSPATFPARSACGSISARRRRCAAAFALRLVRGVKNGPSPEWLQRRLTAIGLRPINALVDITNFITYDRGRPLHVFDAAKVKGDLVVRRARAGRDPARARRQDLRARRDDVRHRRRAGVESLAGIMGGEASGCSEATTDVLIESALWDEPNIAQTGRKLGINSDARYRFERGVDPAFMLPGLELATRMVLDLCGGTPSEIDRRGRGADRRARDRFPARRGEAPRRHRAARARVQARARPARLRPSRQPARRSRSRCRPGAPTCTARPTSSRRWCASSASTACR